MFSVRLFIAVAGVLLMSDANQPEATTRQGRLTNPQSEPLLVNASNENNLAISIIDGYLTPADPTENPIADLILTTTKRSLLLVQGDLNKLLEGTAGSAEKRLSHLLNALDVELFAYRLPRPCPYNGKCDEVSTHVQRATGKIIAAFLKELKDEQKIDTIKKLINGNITENGDIAGGASPQQTKKVAEEVQYVLY